MVGVFSRTTPCLVLAVLCASTLRGPAVAEENREFRKIREQLHVEKLPEQADFPDASAVILLDERQYSMNLEFGAEPRVISQMTSHRIVKVLNQEGKDYGEVKIHIDRGQKVTKLAARTIKADGTVLKVSARDIHDVSDFPDYVLYASSRAKVFAFPAVEPGAILDYDYAISDDDPFSWDIHYFQHRDPTLVTRYSLTVPREILNSGVTWKYKTYRFPQGTPKITDGIDPSAFGKGIRTYTWESRNLAAVKDEESSPPFADLASKIVFAPGLFRSWDDLRARVYGRMWQRMAPDPTVRAKAAELVQGKPTVEDKVKAIYYWIQDRIRYVSVELKESGITLDAERS